MRQNKGVQPKTLFRNDRDRLRDQYPQFVPQESSGIFGQVAGMASSIANRVYRLMVHVPEEGEFTNFQLDEGVDLR